MVNYDDNIIRRPEYQASMSYIQSQVTHMSQSIDNSNMKIDNLSNSVHSKIDNFQESVNQKFDSLTIKRLQGQVSIVKFIAINIVGVVTGSVTYAIGEYLLTHHF